jgi:hypothetical protein
MKQVAAAAILITTMAHAQATRVLTELDITFSRDGKTKEWYAPDDKACINMKTNTPVGVLQTLNEWSALLVDIKKNYQHLNRTKQEVLIPSYCDGIQDYSCMSMALKAQSATVLVRDVFVFEADTMTLTLKMDKQYASVMIVKP